jgi:hypothetical protein
LQAVGDGVVVVSVEVEEFADFGEGECDKPFMGWWRGGRFAGSALGVVQVLGALAPLFLALCAVIARKVWASMDMVMCLCQASQVRTW